MTVSIYQKFEDSTATAESSADEVVVPDLSVFDNVSEMKAVLAHAGLAGAFNASGKPPSKDQEFKFSGQLPAADTKVKRGSTVTVSIYQAFDATGAADTIPDVAEMTQEAAQAKLEGAGLTVGCWYRHIFVRSRAVRNGYGAAALHRSNARVNVRRYPAP